VREILLQVAAPPPSAVPAARFTATSIECTSCRALAGESCTGPRVCPERVSQAVDMMRRGELPEAPERAEGGAQAACPDCQASTFNGRLRACSDAHRCRATRRGGQCRSATLPGLSRCDMHACRIEEDGRRCGGHAEQNGKCGRHLGR
jgi:hypothetical protein